MNDNFFYGSLFALIAAVALVAGAPASQSEPLWGDDAPPSAQVVVLPTVHVIGKRSAEFAAAATVVQLPLVTVTGRREPATQSVAATTTTD